MISSSRLAELQHVPPAWKLSAVQSQERFDRENAQRGGKPRRGHKTHCPAARIEATKKTSAGGTEPGPPARTKRKWKCSEAPFIGVARVLQAAQLHLQLQEAVLLGATFCGQHVGLRARVVVLEGHERAHQSELGFEQQNRFRNLREIQS